MSSLLQRVVSGTGRSVHVEAEAAAAMRAHALAGYPREVVGILGGDRRTGRVQVAAPLENRNADRASDRYDVDPRELMKTERSLEARGLEIVGYYHSHPDHPAMYSDTDRDLAWPDMAYLILAVHGPTPTVVQGRCWRLREDRAEMLEDHLLLPLTEPPAMSVDIHIPTALRACTGGRASVAVQATTVGEALSRLTDENPQLAAQLRDKSGKLRSFVNVYLNDEDIRYVDGGEAAALKPGDSLVIVPSIAGGRA